MQHQRLASNEDDFQRIHVSVFHNAFRAISRSTFNISKVDASVDKGEPHREFLTLLLREIFVIICLYGPWWGTSGSLPSALTEDDFKQDG